MFIGHFGVGFAGKSVAPGISLGMLFLSAQFLDLLWPTLLLLGLETVAIVPGITKVTPFDFVSYPISHSLLTAVGWGSLLAVVYALMTRYRTGAVVVGVLVVSHWLLDAVTHRPDLPLFPGGEVRIGFGLWNSLAGTLVVELSVFALGIWLYVRATRASDRAGSIGLWSLIAFLLVAYLGSLFGEPPPNLTALAWVGQAQWLIVVWGFWIDRHRASVTTS